MVPAPKTTLIERLLLMSTIIFLPLQDRIDYLPRVGGLAIMFIMFGVLAFYIVLNRPHALARVLREPVFRAAYLFLCISLVLEFMHPSSAYVEISRIAQMFAGAACIASLCRDAAALRACITGYIVVGVGASILLFLTGYGGLEGATASDFSEASVVRIEVFSDLGEGSNLNQLAFVCAQGTVLGLVLFLYAHSQLRRWLALGIAVFCLIASFLPLSRSGAGIALISPAIVMLTYGTKRGRFILVAIVICASLMIFVPDAVWKRMAFTLEPQEGKLEGRARIYLAVVTHFPKYALTGVGAGHFQESWGWTHGFARTGEMGEQIAVVGAHNVFAQVTIYWGIAGLTAFLFVLWQAYRSLPKYCNREAESLCLLGICGSLLLLTMVAHNFYAKDFSLGLGLLVGARCWIWPAGIVETFNLQGNVTSCHPFPLGTRPVAVDSVLESKKYRSSLSSRMSR
jgi:hypothetical protein